jgi:anti-sigma factor RsiW
MTCAEVVRQIPFYGYGEISSEVEEQIESHLELCPECRNELARHRAFLDALDERDDVMDPTLLTTCRAGLRRQLEAESVPAAHQPWFDTVRRVFSFHIPVRIPVGAAALVALGWFVLGWFGARYAPARFGGVRAGLAEPMFSNVKSVEPDASGNVRISVDEVQRHVVSGSLEDPRIQELLLNAVREEENPGVRVESIGILKNNAESEQVRRALIDVASHDPDAGVRLKALEGLKEFTTDPAVRETVANVLLGDNDPAVRVQAIDLLTAHHDDSMVGILQDVVQKEDDSYVRARCRKLLEAMKASVGTY